MKVMFFFFFTKKFTSEFVSDQCNNTCKSMFQMSSDSHVYQTAYRVIGSFLL